MVQLTYKEDLKRICSHFVFIIISYKNECKCALKRAGKIVDDSIANSFFIRSIHMIFLVK